MIAQNETAPERHLVFHLIHGLFFFIVCLFSASTVPLRTLQSLRDAGRIIRRRNVHRNVPIIRRSSMFIFGPDNS